MSDEYGTMDDAGDTLTVPKFALESGLTLADVRIRYRTWGTLSPAADNAIFVAHALTGNAALDSWWSDVLGEGKALDTSKYLVICANVLGSCYGTTGPRDMIPPNGAPWASPHGSGEHAYGSDFPYVTVRDTVCLHQLLVTDLGVSQLTVVGGSMGGMQALEWVILFPTLVQRAVVIACGAVQSA